MYFEQLLGLLFEGHTHVFVSQRRGRVQTIPQRIFTPHLFSVQTSPPHHQGETDIMSGSREERSERA